MKTPGPACCMPQVVCARAAPLKPNSAIAPRLRKLTFIGIFQQSILNLFYMRIDKRLCPALRVLALGALVAPPYWASSSFSAADQAAFLHNTFDRFYRSSEGAVPQGTQVTLRFRTGHFAVDGVSVRAYLFDTGSGKTTGPIDTAMSFDQNITV